MEIRISPETEPFTTKKTEVTLNGIPVFTTEELEDGEIVLLVATEDGPECVYSFRVSDSG